MIGGLIKSKDESDKKITEDEVKQLREKFKEIVEANPQGTPESRIQKASGSINAIYSQKGGAQNIELVDPEKVIDNERIINLIMQQIKELIEIDSNLNARIKEIETKIEKYSYSLTETKNLVERFSERLDFIEKNMEKFMGLYEVVTNIFNPFTENTAADIGTQQVSQQQGNTYIDTFSAMPNLGTSSVSAAHKDTNDTVSSFAEKAAARDAAKISSKKTTASPMPKPETKETITPMPKTETKEILTQVQEPKTKEIIIEKPQEASAVIIAEGGSATVSDSADSQNKSEISNEKTTLNKTTANDNTLNTVNAKSPSAASETASQKTPEIIDKNDNSFKNAIVPADFHFTLPDGSEVKSVNDLINAVKKMDDNSFARFVNEESHDFAEWIKYATGNHKRAVALEKLKKKEEFLAELEK